MIGRVVGNYRIDALLGSGGMGAVYRAHDLLLERPVAIKALRADAATDPRSAERFRLEARTLARLLHPNIATLYTLVREPAPKEAGGDAFYMVMEFCDGETVESILRRRGRLTPAEALPLFTQALDGLEHAHRHGIVHRDIKPANLMRLPGGTVKVMDFGIARLLGSSRMTQTHHTIGTAAYMAPEQIRSQDVDARADVYALGVLLYELLTGRVPFTSESFFEVMQAHLQTPPPPPRQFAPDLPEDLEAVILRALAKDPDDRFPSVVALRVALHALGLPTTSLPDPEPTMAESRPSSGSTPAASEPATEREDVTERENASPPSASAARPSGAPAPEQSVDTLAPTVVVPSLSASRSATSRAPAAATSAAATSVRERLGLQAALVIVGLVLAVTVGMWLLASPSDEILEPLGAAQEENRAPSLRAPDVAAPLAPSPTELSLGTTSGILDSAEETRFLEDITIPEEAGQASHTGSLSVTSNLPGAIVLVDGVPFGRAPLSLSDLRPGTYVVTLTLPGYVPLSYQAEVTAQSVSVVRATFPPRPESQEPTAQREPTPDATGTVRVLVRPFGDVYVDGRRRATNTNAPVFAELAPGTHRVRVTHPTFGAQDRSVTVRAGQTAEVFIEFATPAQVTVVSDPLNAEIRLDGQATGRYTPATVTIPPGRHTVEVRREGFRPASRSITVTAEASVERLSFSLVPVN